MLEEKVAMPVAADFVRLTEPYRRELLAHCYRMMGTVDEAEDLVQETYLRAWRSYDGFEGRSSPRTWLYRIATNACLSALQGRGRRPLPSGLGGPSETIDGPPAPPEVTWLQPLADDPAAVVLTRGSLRLALIAALQHLPARQRAVLILRDVLGWSTTEVAEALDTTTAAVKSTLQRARAQLQRVAPAEDHVAEPPEPGVRALLARYMSAFERADTAALARLLTDDVALEMPPLPTWLRGRETVARFAGSHIFGPAGSLKLVPLRANGQPATATYRRGGDGLYRAHAIQVLTFTGEKISSIVAFLDPDLFPRFGLAATA
ncbi:RNA polymerase sigma-70 factor (ECF subfamily) [Amycolatopsis endophytica]|uniref:RNA polymerase sigma factor n=1 Tax=Amycolatopsis endophytica TaxID=860233 RepID=A0A853BEV8_9PSEU|nr:RNA polymerase sigma-70 factor (ECF subfamily) [Amycolatopsis endophytica]